MTPSQPSQPGGEARLGPAVSASASACREAPGTLSPPPASPSGPDSPRPSGLRERKKERTRRALSEGAVTLFLERGHEDETALAEALPGSAPEGARASAVDAGRPEG